MPFDLIWPWSVLDLDHMSFTSNISNTGNMRIKCISAIDTYSGWVKVWHNNDGCMAVERGVTDFHENNYNYKYQQTFTSDESVFCNLSFTNYYEANSSRIWLVELSNVRWMQSTQQFNTHAIRSSRVSMLEFSFCTWLLSTCQMFSIMLISGDCAGQEILEIACLLFHWRVIKERCTGALSSCKNHGLSPRCSHTTGHKYYHYYHGYASGHNFIYALYVNYKLAQLSCSKNELLLMKLPALKCFALPKNPAVACLPRNLFFCLLQCDHCTVNVLFQIVLNDK